MESDIKEAFTWSQANQRPGEVGQELAETARSILLLQGEILRQWRAVGRGKLPSLEAAN